MNSRYPRPLESLIDCFSRFPGVGPKSAERMALFLLHEEDVFLSGFSNQITTLKDSLCFCNICGNLSEESCCRLCLDPARDRKKICVVEEFRDILALEQTGEYCGLYHVLGGAIAPLKGVREKDLNISPLPDRIRSASPDIEEVILALNPTLEGETTTLYLMKILRPLGLNITQIGYGVPLGGDLEFTDKVTLGHSLRGRKTLGG